MFARAPYELLRGTAAVKNIACDKRRVDCAPSTTSVPPCPACGISPNVSGLMSPPILALLNHDSTYGLQETLRPVLWLALATEGHQCDCPAGADTNMRRGKLRSETSFLYGFETVRLKLTDVIC